MTCVISTHKKSLGGKQANKWLRKDAWRKGLMNNTGPLGHMINSLQTNLPGCLQGTALGSLGVTKMNETALLPQN